MAYRVQRLPTRRQHERLSAMHCYTPTNSVTWSHGLGAVYPGAPEGRGGGNLPCYTLCPGIASPLHRLKKLPHEPLHPVWVTQEYVVMSSTNLDYLPGPLRSEPGVVASSPRLSDLI